MTAGPGTRAFYERFQGMRAGAKPTARAEEPTLRRLVADFGLKSSRVLEIGSGRAAFDGLSTGWVGIDLAVEARRFTKRPFVVGSAEALPFRGETFAGAWTIAVLEHVHNPESALEELDRVLTPGGVACLAPAWHCRPWAANGIHLRRYRELRWRQRLIKLSIPVRETLAYRAALEMPKRLWREMAYQARPKQPTRLRFGHLMPNYETFWCADSDACSVLDPHEFLVFFLSRGWSSPSHPGIWDRLLVRHGPIVVRKP